MMCRSPRRLTAGLAWSVALGLVICLLAPVAATAQSDTIPGVRTPVVTTTHRITLNGKPLSYTARAGVLPIRSNETAEPLGYIFFVAYVVDRAPGQPARPLTFAWNGGPGANSLLVHLDAMGPHRLNAGDGGTSPRVALAFEDNEATWLDETDLVFVDPVGTGFSRAAKPQYFQGFYGVMGDIAATREFIRVYRTRFDAWDSPVYLAGESYGTWRAAGTADAMERNNEHVVGVIAISGGIPVGPVLTPEMRAATFLSTRTASAFFHGKLAPDLMENRDRALAEVDAWARSVYEPALVRRDALTPADRADIVQRLARYTGLDTSKVDKQTLVVDRQFLIDNLLKDRNQGALGRFDTRQIAGSAPLLAEAAEAPRRRALINNYLRNELGFATDLVYQGLESGYRSSTARGPNWDYDNNPPGAALARNTDGPPGPVPSWLRSAMEMNPSLRAFVAMGQFDSLNSCSAGRYILDHIPPPLGKNITLGCYEGGHMMYDDRPARFALKRDIVRFYRGR